MYDEKIKIPILQTFSFDVQTAYLILTKFTPNIYVRGHNSNARKIVLKHLKPTLEHAKILQKVVFHV